MTKGYIKAITRRYNLLCLWYMGLFSLFQRNNQGVDDATITHIEKFDNTLNPNLRALRFTMRTCEIMLSMGVSANSVVSRALDITETYCKNPVHIDITYNIIFLSQFRGVDKEPLTLVRPAPPHDVNYMMLRSVQVLIHDIHNGHVSLQDAEKRLDKIEFHSPTYPWWLIMIGNGVVIAGVSLMFTSSWRAILTTFIVGLIVDRLMYFMGRKSIAPFFRQITAAVFVTLTAAVINALASNGVDFFDGINPTLLVVGSIVMLVAGLATVSAMQDAIEEYYVTANGRLTRVILQTAGLVVGIVIGLYAARRLGIGIAISPDPLSANTIPMQVIGAALAAAGYAISSQTYNRAISWVGLIGGISLSILFVLNDRYGISVVVSSAIAAAFVGIVGAFMSRFWRTPSVGIIAAGIIPLVPGLMLYSGLMQLINYPPGNPLFYKALGTLFTVATTGLAIATGASLGSILGRPFRQTLAPNRNMWPFMSSLHKQTQSRRNSLALFALHPGKFFEDVFEKVNDKKE